METSQYNGIVGSDSYRLIEEVVEYPIGTKAEDNRINKTFTKEVDGWYTSSKTGHTDKSISNAKHIEVLEEIIEKDYEILSLITNNKTILNTPFLCVDDLLKNQGCSIHSIKRLSDSEVFTIKDHARPKKCNPNAFTITGFTLDCNNKHMLALGGNGGISINKLKHIKKPLFKTFDNVDIYEGDDLFWLHKKTNSIGKWIWNNCNTNLNDDRWLFFSTKQAAQDYINSKKVLFTTEDGVDIFKGDYFWYSDGKIFDKGKAIDSNIRLYLKYFSTKEAAEEYIIMNKPCLSINDILKFCGSTQSDIIKTISLEGLQQLVKSKL